MLFFIVTDVCLRKKDRDMLVDGWKWLARGSRRLPHKNPQYHRSLYFYHCQEGEERGFKRYVYERLDDERVLPSIFVQFIYSSLKVLTI